MRPGVTNTLADFIAVKSAFERNYGCMQITCQDVGGIWDSSTSEYMGDAAPCGTSSSSSVNVGLAVGLSIAGLVVAVFAYCLCRRYCVHSPDLKGSTNSVA